MKSVEVVGKVDNITTSTIKSTEIQKTHKQHCYVYMRTKQKSATEAKYQIENSNIHSLKN